MKRILTRNEYLKNINSKYYSKYTGINEAAFANDTNWGDTLVGRLINSLARKTKIVFNQKRMTNLVNKMKEYFDLMIDIGKFEIVDTSSFNFIKISNLLGILKKQVEDGEDVDKLIKTTEDLIYEIDSYSFDKKDIMIEVLEDFLDYLKGLKKADPDKTLDSDKKKDSDKDPNVLFLEYSKNFLQSVVDLHNIIKENVVRFGGSKEKYANKVAVAKSKLEVGKEYMYINNEGVEKRCLLISKTDIIEKAEDKKWLTKDDIKKEPLNNDQVFVVFKMGKDDYNKIGIGNSVEALKIYKLDGTAPDSKVEKPGEDVSTYFNKEKYDSIQNALSGKKEDSQRYAILRNSINMEQEAINIAQKKNDNKSLEYYKNRQNDNLKKLINIQARSYGISLEIKDSNNKPTGKYKNLEKLKGEIKEKSKKTWSIDLPLGKSVGNKPGGEPSLPSGKEKGELQKASYSFLYEEVEANLQKDETDAKNAWNKVVNAYNKSGISKFISQIEELLSISSKDGKEKLEQSKKDIVAICKQVISNKSTTGKPISFEELVNEAVNVNDIAKSISLFGRILLAFEEDMGLTGNYGSAIKPLKEFINKFSELEKLLPSLSKNERISNYSRFLLIRERNEFSDEIKTKFDELFTEEIIGYFEITEERRSDIEKSVKNPDKYDFVFDGEDFILSIVRLFQRAYRIHTPGVIPSGRTDGKVSNSVFREYEYIGKSNPGEPKAPGSGPYRNIELFETWHEGVWSIINDTKYRPIFSEKAVLRFNSDESGKGDPIEKGGKILLAFITRLLDDVQMYRGGSNESGALPQFIKEYFGVYLKFENGGAGGGPILNKENSETANGAEDRKTLKLKKTSSLKNILAKNIAFKAIFTDIDKKDKTLYFIIRDMDKDDVFMLSTKSNFAFDKTKIEIEGNISEPNDDMLVFKGKIINDKFEGKFIDIKDYQNISSKASDKTIEFKNIEVLYDKEDNLYSESGKIHLKFKDFDNSFNKIKNSTYM
jgi:hypothetical protein